MATTKQIPREQWEAYFDEYTKKHLRDDRPEAATIEVVSPMIGDQIEEEGAVLQGISYDPKDNALEVLVEGLDHLVFNPKEVWVVEDEEDEGFLTSVEIVREDGTKEILSIRRTGLPAPRA